MTRKTYNNINESELYYLVSENNEDANDLFYEKYDNVIRMKATKYKKYVESKGYDFNDILQEGRVGLSYALRDFKEQKNIQFNSFANICIDRQLASFVRNIAREKHEILNNAISLDTTKNTVGRPINEILDDKNINPEDSFINSETIEELYNNVRDLLTDQEKDVFDLRMQGFTYKEISNLLDVSRKSVDGCMQRIKTKASNIVNSSEKHS